MTKSIRARSTQLLASVAIGAAVLTVTPMLGVWPVAPARAQYVVDAEFRTALSPYGRWQHHGRWGEVWLPEPIAADWRPYTRGRWVYTDDWGWYWEAADEEAAWGWVAYHYGRWVHDRELGWIWVPGEDWGPAWVDWRYGGDYVGWAPLPPDDLLVEYRDDPVYWSFVRPRYLLAPRVFLVFAPPRERIVIIRRTKIVNRTVIIDRDRDRDRNRDRDRGDRDRSRGRVAVNAGIEPGIIARATGKPIRAAKVEPVVLKGTKVDGAREVDAREGRRVRASIKETNVVIKPAARIEPPKELGANEKGRLGERPPKAAQTRNGPDNGSRSGEDRSRNNRSSDQGRSPPPPPVNVIRGGNDSGRSASPPPPPAVDRGNQQRMRIQSPPPPPAVDRGNQQRMRIQPPPPPPAVDRGNQQRMRIQSPPPTPPAVLRSPPPPPIVRRSPPPPPPPVMRPSPPPPPPAANQRRPQEQRGNRQNQQDERLR
ncbi:MAG TPA: DUF6600 domain-containing protein [Xanthobacteraceae bacterium]|nr:DUF6600 domain-containing protein [Xanthobacteraceae bacterium]